MTKGDAPFPTAVALPLSKSLLNRWMILLSFFPESWTQASATLREWAYRSGEDTRHLFEALSALVAHDLQSHSPLAHATLTLDCGEGGAPFRFLAMRASRSKGSFLITGTPRLLSRPMSELKAILPHFGVKCEWLPELGLKIDSEGWKAPSDAAQVTVKIDRSRSSQFLSAAVLSSVGLPFDLVIETPQEGALSEPYAAMTLTLVEERGVRREGSLSLSSLRLLASAQTLTCHAWSGDQWLDQMNAELESDWSSAWSVAAHALVSQTESRVCLSGLKKGSLQADSVFPTLLNQIAPHSCQWNSEGTLLVFSSEQRRGVEVDLRPSPDLFPVLVSLAVLAQTPSRLSGLESLQHKESDRLARMMQLVEACGAKCRLASGTLEIFPAAHPVDSTRPLIEFDPDHDHRLAMAASVLQLAGVPIRIHHPEVVKKSFPEFWTQIHTAFGTKRVGEKA
jgi:3-phosphoshikimate 1-carboxyvinyltransferase